jgi:hypothetical protein
MIKIRFRSLSFAVGRQPPCRRRAAAAWADFPIFGADGYCPHVDGTTTRRQFVGAAVAGAAALALPGRGLAGLLERTASGGFAVFRSAPSLKPPTLTVTTSAHPSPGYLFVASLTGPGQRGPLLLDNAGNVVWFRPVKTVAINFRRQLYAGKPVLTWWEGTISKIGTGQGEGVIVDQSYRTVARVDAGNGYRADVHEFLLTPAGTALITVYNPVQRDLSSVGGPTSGTVLDSIVQEVDVKSGRVLFEWHSLDHVPLTDTYAPLLDPFDYFHVNSIDVDLDGDLLVSARNTSAVYKLDRTSGRVLWRLGGRSSDFELGPRTFFMYQHDARGHSDGTLTLFDDGPSDSSQQSRAIRIGLDLGAMRADLLQEYVHPSPLAASAMGNAQVLSGNGMLVGWGTEPYVTEFGPGGEVRFDAKFDGDAWNYRAFRDAWVGRPATRPVAVARPRARGAAVYASWNGSTETAYWRVAAGDAPATLEPVQTVPRRGFETAIALAHRPRYVAVAALDRAHRVLGTSRAVALA